MVETKVLCFDTEILNEKKSLSVYLLKTKTPCIVETGPACVVERVLRFVDSSGVKRDKIKYIFLTHVHLDHGGGVGDLLEHLPSAKVVCHPKAVKHLVNPEKLWNATKNIFGNIAEMYGEPKPVDEERIISAEDYENFDLSSDVMLSIHTPGHANHQVSFYLKEDGVLFPGDSAGVYSYNIVVPTTPPPFLLEPALKSIDKMLELEPRFIAYSHFGIAENGHLLETVRDRFELWCELAIQVVKNRGKVNQLHSMLLEKDEGYKELYNLTKDSLLISSFRMMTLMGLLDFATKTTSKSI